MSDSHGDNLMDQQLSETSVFMEQETFLLYQHESAICSHPETYHSTLQPTVLGPQYHSSLQTAVLCPQYHSSLQTPTLFLLNSFQNHVLIYSKCYHFQAKKTRG